VIAASLCLAAAGFATARLPLPEGRFTLEWTHSIEKIRWQEDYLVAGGWLYLDQARVRGTGAGMEVPEGARLERGVYRYRPKLRWFRELRLARSGYAADYRLCVDGAACRPMSDWLPVASGLNVLRDCAAEDSIRRAGRRRSGAASSP
jgi:hypothetical protein